MAGQHTQGPFDRRYVEFFERFNRCEYFEAHEVLEDLWRVTRDERRDFYKGLIQTAAVFLKLQQAKPAPAARLAARALSHLRAHRPRRDGLDVAGLTELLEQVEAGRNPLAEGSPPRLRLESQTA
jgi:predicted metal-dependent hydrolase